MNSDIKRRVRGLNPLIPKDGGDLTDNPLFSVPEGQVTNKDDPPGKRIIDYHPLS
ncbi:MAG TPA: hypothetical protein IGS40_23180 [Trichormus sp. M33_DOE_039]|nr:hypothetical protein [Trichormus sp. M33_DOE_039]